MKEMTKTNEKNLLKFLKKGKNALKKQYFEITFKKYIFNVISIYFKK